jgi:hypothetical protein
MCLSNKSNYTIQSNTKAATAVSLCGVKNRGITKSPLSPNKHFTIEHFVTVGVSCAADVLVCRVEIVFVAKAQ